MSIYIHFTDEQKARARQTDLVSLLRSQGETVKRSGKEYEWRDGSQKVTIRGNLWYHQYEEVGGDAIDFVRRFYNKDYPEAMEYLLGGCGGTLIVSPPIVKEVKPFELPPKNDTMRRVYAYLVKHRGIDSDVLNTFVKAGMIYESEDYHNAVFVGYDTNGIARHAHKRGTGQASTFKGNIDSCIPEYSFHWNGQAEPARNSHTNNIRASEYSRLRPSNRLYLFEAPIDMLSFISLNKDEWQKHSYAACCGVADHVLWQMLEDNPNIHTVCLCMDNDEAGQKANRRIADKLKEKRIQTEILVPTHKDWNEDLLYQSKESEVEEPCQALVL